MRRGALTKSLIEAFLCLSLILIVFAALPLEVLAVEVNTTIAVGTNPQGVACDSGTNEIFVANSADNTVSVISQTTKTLIANIAVGLNPVCLAYDPILKEVFVTNSGSNSVSVISDQNNTVIANITVGAVPNGIAYDSAKQEMFVVNKYSDSVSVISDQNNTVVATIPVGHSNPIGAVYDSAKGEVFVTVNYMTGETHGFVQVISDKTNTVVATIPVGVTPYYPAYDFGKGEIFVPNHDSSTLSVISDKTNKVVANITLNLLVWPWQVAYDSTKSVLFVTNDQHGDLNGTVSVIYDSNNTIIGQITQASVYIGKQASYASPLDIFPFYRANHPGDVTYVDTYIGCQPNGLAYDSATGELFIANYNAGNVSVVSDAFLPSPPPNQTMPMPKQNYTLPIVLIAAAAAVVLFGTIIGVRKNVKKQSTQSTIQLYAPNMRKNVSSATRQN